MNSQVHNFKIKEPCRDQMEMNLFSLDQLIPPDHKARAVWDFVNTMDTRACFIDLKTFKGYSGRSASSPKVLFALWIYSILDGNTSARKLEELCNNHNAYKWIAGGIPINRTMLANFRSDNPIKFEDLLTSCLAAMIKAGVLKDEDFSQDGTRVKANAGYNTYRREETLLNIKQELSDYIKELDAESALSGYEKREKSKRERIAKERLDRVERALINLEQAREAKIENSKKHSKPPSEDDLKEVRSSITDPEVRRMKMGDSGFRLAYNVQFATGLDSRVIYGVDVVNTLDPGTAPRMMCRVHSRLRALGLGPPKNWIADSAYSSKKDVECIAELFPNCCYYAPPKTPKSVDPKKVLKTDSDAVKKWRSLIDNEEVNEIYKLRCSTAEFSNAQVKNKGMTKFSLRGLIKAKGEALLNAIAQNISRFWNLKLCGEGELRADGWAV